MEPWFDEAETNALALYMKSGGWLTEYSETRELEGLIASYVGSEHCIMMPSGTLALYAMLKVLGITGEVIVPDMTMIATANAVRMAGAQPVFADISIRDLCLNLYALSDHITRRTSAILLVSLNGRAPNMDMLHHLTRKYNLILLEDAAQSLGSTWQGKHLGTFGLAGVFSFSCQKIISTGNGGCVVTDDTQLAQELRIFKDFGRKEGGHDKYETFGINLKFTDLQAVVGIQQMKKLPWRVERKKEIYDLYRNLLIGITELTLVTTDLEFTCPWFVDILAKDREGLSSFLGMNSISTRPMYPAIRLTPPYGYGGAQDWISDTVAKCGLWLPSSSQLADTDIRMVCDVIKEYYG